MSTLLAVPVLAPLAVAGADVLLLRSRVAQRLLSAALFATVLAAGLVLLTSTAADGPLAIQVGGWPPGFAIPLVADVFAALLLSVTALMTLVCVAFAAVRGEDRHPLFHPLAAVLSCGVSGTLLTGDLFNLFVFFEVMLIASYVLLTLKGRRAQVRAGAVYIPVNLLASTILLAGVALLYGVTGTVNLGALHGAGSSPAAGAATGVIAVAVAVKAAIVPLHGWLPRAYVHAAPGVAALFSGLLTKAGVYVLYRLYAVIFAGDPRFGGLLLAVAVVTMVVGVLGAVGRDDVRGILAFHMVSQIGYLILPLGVFTPAVVAAGVFYFVQYIVVKGALFLVAGAIEHLTGSGRLAELGGMARRQPLLAVAFGVAAMALAGLPPLSGFVGKMLLVIAAFDAGAWAAGGVAVVVSLFTLMSMVKIWNGVFWAPPPSAEEARRTADGRLLTVPAGGSGEQPPARGTKVRASSALALTVPPLLLAALTVVWGVAAEGLLELSTRAADGLVDAAAYVEAVLGP